MSNETIFDQITRLDTLISGDADYFLDFNICSLFIGYNDLKFNSIMGKRSDAVGAATMAGKLKYFIETVLTSNPEIEIYIMTLPEVVYPSHGISYKGKVADGWGALDLEGIDNGDML